MKRILLIGGSGAIGQEIAPLLEALGYDVTSTNSLQLDVTDRIDFFKSYCDDVDIVVNLAGVTQSNLLDYFNVNTQELIDVNCMGAVNVLAGFLSMMQEKQYGRIIMISSIYSKINVARQGVYSASKAFVDKLVQIAAIENAQYGITVNSIQLGYMGIGMGTVDEDDRDRVLRKTALYRFCDPQELVNTIDYIIKTEYVTGQNITLGGGLK